MPLRTIEGTPGSSPTLDERVGEEPAASDVKRHPRLKWRLSTGLLLVTMFAVMMAEVFIFVPSIANFRKEWLTRKIQTVAVAGVSVDQGGAEQAPALGEAQQAALLSALDASLVAIVKDGTSRLLARRSDIGRIDIDIDLADQGTMDLILDAFGTLIAGADRMIRVVGPVGDGSMRAEVVFSEHDLRMAMLLYSRNIFVLSLVIASFAALLVYLAISRLLIAPIGRMTRSIVRFSENPADADRIILPSGRMDEIGLAETELAGMQTVLARTLREQRHLADLGLAVSKINHDLRNILASAQLISDRLSELPDPRAQRMAPLLIRSLDRALNYTQSVLAYGRAVESTPVKRKVMLHRLVDDVYELLAMAPETGTALVNAVPKALEIDVDPDQFYRAIANLCRNAVEAMDDTDDGAVVRRLTVGAEAAGEGTVLVFVEDTGPGLPERARSISSRPSADPPDPAARGSAWPSRRRSSRRMAGAYRSETTASPARVRNPTAAARRPDRGALREAPGRAGGEEAQRSDSGRRDRVA